MVLEKTLESPLDCKEIQPVPPKVDQSWVFIGRTDVEVETPVLWSPDVEKVHLCVKSDNGLKLHPMVSSYCIILYLPSHEPDVEAMGK